ncbi:MAG: MFS transporter [Candidatus Heimdallarchaeota archaeon]
MELSNRNGRYLSLFSAFIIHGSVEIPFFIYPVIVLLVGDDLFPGIGVDRWLALGFLGTIAAASAALPSPLFGRLADRHRRGKLMLFSLFLATLGSFSIGMWGDSYIMMMVAQGLLGCALALYHPPGLSWVTTAFEDETNAQISPKYVRILATHGIGGTLGAAIGPLSVYFLINPLTWRQIYSFWVLPLIVVASTFWILVGRHEALPGSSDTKDHSNPLSTNPVDQFKGPSIPRFPLTLVLLFGFIISISITRGIVNFILSPYLAEVKNFEVGTAALFVGLSTLVGAFGEISGGFFADRYGEKVVLVALALLQVIILAGIYVFTDRTLLLALYLLLGILLAFFWPSTNSLVAKQTKQRGVGFGWVMLTAHLFGALGPVLAGQLRVIDPTQYFLIFATACFCSVIGFFFLIFFHKSSSGIKLRNHFL